MVLNWNLLQLVFPQVKTVDISFTDTTTGENSDDLKKLKSAFLLFCQGNIVSIISNTRDSVSLHPNTEKRVGNTMGSRVFLTKFEVFG